MLMGAAVVMLRWAPHHHPSHSIMDGAAWRPFQDHNH